MAVQKPELLPSTWAYVVNDIDPTDPEYSEIIEKPDQTKIDTGWEFGEKPSHKWFNWGWKNIDDFLHHTNTFGVPVWDDTTEYEIGSVVLYNFFIYKANAANVNEPPGSGSSWDIVQKSLEDLLDTNITYPSDPNEYHILQYNNSSSLWENVPLTSITPTFYLENLSDIEYDGSLIAEEALMYDAETMKWKNANLNIPLSKTGVISTLIDVQNAVPSLNDIIRYNGALWNIESNHISEIDWDNIINKPVEYRPSYATNTVPGGVRVERIGKSLYIENRPEAAPNAPRNLITENGNARKVTCLWKAALSGAPTLYFKIYRDNNELQTGLIDAYYEDEAVEPDKEYLYFVTAVNEVGESDASNAVIGHTFIEPSAPLNLTFTLSGRDVLLEWEEPSTVSGDITYQIYKDDTQIAQTGSTFFTDENLAIGTYVYSVTAKNKYYESVMSNKVTVNVQ